jgi:hypothetical protein
LSIVSGFSPSNGNAEITAVANGDIGNGRMRKTETITSTALISEDPSYRHINANPEKAWTISRNTIEICEREKDLTAHAVLAPVIWGDMQQGIPAPETETL